MLLLGLPAGVEWLILLLIPTILFIVHIYYLIKCIKNKTIEPTNKIIGVVLILFLPIIGIILYKAVLKK